MRARTQRVCQAYVARGTASRLVTSQEVQALAGDRPSCPLSSSGNADSGGCRQNEEDTSGGRGACARRRPRELPAWDAVVRPAKIFAGDLNTTAPPYVSPSPRQPSRSHDTTTARLRLSLYRHPDVVQRSFARNSQPRATRDAIVSANANSGNEQSRRDRATGDRRHNFRSEHQFP